LKHGPPALVDKDMPVIAIAPNDALLEKLKSNLQEVCARGGELYVFADADTHIAESDNLHVSRLAEHAGWLSPILHTIPLQLLAYRVALQKGTDVDKPKNLAKSVTVEQVILIPDKNFNNLSPFVVSLSNHPHPSTGRTVNGDILGIFIGN